MTSRLAGNLLSDVFRQLSCYLDNEGGEGETQHPVRTSQFTFQSSTYSYRVHQGDLSEPYTCQLLSGQLTAVSLTSNITFSSYPSFPVDHRILYYSRPIENLIPLSTPTEAPIAQHQHLYIYIKQQSSYSPSISNTDQFCCPDIRVHNKNRHSTAAGSEGVWWLVGNSTSHTQDLSSLA